MFKNDLIFKARRRSLRKNQTEAETVMWQKLRRRQLLGLKFYRQYSIGDYILDFFCPKLSLAIEIDGGQHADQIEYDQQRTAFLEKNNIKVLRFWNNEVMQNLDGILLAISQYLRE